MDRIERLFLGGDRESLHEFIGRTSAQLKGVQEQLISLKRQTGELNATFSMMQMTRARLVGWMIGASTVGGIVATLFSGVLVGGS